MSVQAKINNYLGLFVEKLWNYVFTYVPLHSVRGCYLKLFLKDYSFSSSVLMGVKIRCFRGVEIGEHSVINQQVILDGRNGLTIGSNVDIAVGSHIWTMEHDPQSDFHDCKGGHTIIEDYAWISSRVTVLPGLVIGKGAVVASGSVVTKNVAAKSIVAGIPAKCIGERKSNLKYTLSYKPFLE